MKKKILKVSFLALVLLFLVNPLANAQMVGPAAYIKATSLEIGIDGTGGFEGSDTTVSPPLPGMHFRSGNPYFGFVANPQVNLWATYDGDFFTPGSPENGWGIEIPGIGLKASNNCAPSPPTFAPEIPGAITDWQHVFDCYYSDWEGDVTTGTNIHIKVNYFLQETDLFYTTSVSITNNTGATIPELFYYRNLDPDNNVTINGGIFDTENTIVSQPGGVGCNLAHVKATSTLPSTQPQSYVGLAAIGAEWRAMYGGFSNRDATDIWNASGLGFVGTVGSSLYADQAIAIAYRIQNLAPGATETIRFVVILDDASATQAINNLLHLTYPGSTIGVPQVCTPEPDTIPTCGTAVPISVTGTTTADYNWTWSPATGLSTTTGSSTVANPATTTTYTVSGAPTSTCVAPVSFEFVVLVTPPDGNAPEITAVPLICESSAPFNLAVDSLGGTWYGSGIVDPVNGTFDPGTAGIGTNLITYITSGYCNTTDTMVVTVVAGPTVNVTQPPPYCAFDPAFNLTGSPSGGTWSGLGIPSGGLSPGGTIDPDSTGAGVFVVSYSVAGTCIATDTALVTIVITFPSTITNHVPVCEGSAAFNFAAATAGGTWSGTGITNPTAGTFNPTTVGTFVVSYALPGLCGTTDTTLITVLPQVNAVITTPTPVCANDPSFTLAATPTGGTWSGTGTSSSGTFNPSVGAGTYTLTYNVAGGCGDSDTDAITVFAIPVPSFTSNLPGVCEGLCVTFDEAVSTTCTDILYNFGDGSVDSVTNPVHCYDSAGVYSVSVTCTNTNGCTGTTTNPNMITVYSYPDADFTFLPGSPVAPNAPINFTDITNGSIGSFWMFGDTLTGVPNTSTLPSTSHSYSGEGNYCITLVSTSDGGCMDTAKYCLDIIGEATIFYPNVFTPNGDGDNDFFQIGVHHIRELTYDIYDRWGLLIASHNGVTGGWNGKTKNGKMAPDGVYYYILKATADNGDLFEHQGFVQLLSEK